VVLDRDQATSSGSHGFQDGCLVNRFDRKQVDYGDTNAFDCKKNNSKLQRLQREIMTGRAGASGKVLT